MTTRSILLLGATGLVGNECLKLLLQHGEVSRIVALTRIPLPILSDKLVNRTLSFDNLGDHASDFAVDAVICALGTTIGKAGSEEAFRKVDHDYPLAAAHLAFDMRVQHFLLVSSLGADARSKVFYNRVKGEIEKAVAAIPFPSIIIVRPSLLLGERSEFRLGERIGQFFAPVIRGKYQPIQARKVARQLVDSAIEVDPGVHIIESSEMNRRYTL